MTFRHVVWDWNGTLLDDVWLCVDVINTMLRERRLPEVNPDSYRDQFGFPVIDYYGRLGLEIEEQEFRELSQVYINSYEARREECALHPQAREVLTAIQAAGYPQSILSAYRQDMLETIVSRFDIGRYFSHLMGNSDIYASGKLERGRLLLEKLDVPPEEVVMIGDTDHDFEVARDLGMSCLLVEHGHHTRERLGRLGPKVLPNLEAVALELGANPTGALQGQKA